MSESIIELFGTSVFAMPLTVGFLWLTDRSRFIKKWFWVVLFVVYMNAALDLVGMTNISYFRWHPVINWIPFTNFCRSNVIQMLLNVVLFIPFGGFLAIYFKRYQDWRLNLLSGFLFSLLIETMQLFIYRATDIDDLIVNTLGTIIGCVIARIFFKKALIVNESADKLKMIGMVLLMVLNGFITSPILSLL